MSNIIPKEFQNAIGCSACIQCLITLAIIAAYFRNKKMRQRLGSIIVGFAISAFCLSILWTINFFNMFTESTDGYCQIIGFLALFNEYNVIFYEIGIIYYLIWLFKPGRSSRDLSVSNIQARIHCYVLISSLTLTLIPAVSDDLGVDFYGACSKEWRPEPQLSGVIFTILITGIAFLANAVGLTYFSEEEDGQNELNAEEIDMGDKKHHRNHLWIILGVTTIPVWGLAMTNIYADLAKNKDNDSLRNLFTIIHFLMIAIQGFTILVLKLIEPAILNAVKGIFHQGGDNDLEAGLDPNRDI